MRRELTSMNVYGTMLSGMVNLEHAVSQSLSKFQSGSCFHYASNAKVSGEPFV
jgi:hypothetical protein